MFGLSHLARPATSATASSRKVTRLRRWTTSLAVAAFSVASTLALPSTAALAGTPKPGGQHVLLISVDGLHASDLSQWVAANPSSNLAALAAGGTTYTEASTSEPSDSFPGLIAQVTGGTPKTTGVYYDDSYARDMWAPGSNCVGAPGAETVYAENIDMTVNGQIPLFTSIDPTQLPMGMVNGVCIGIYPHSFLQTNTIFNVAHAAGLYTAWSDKHPAYEIINGPSGVGVNDLFTPEINNQNDPTTISVAATSTYDQIKVQAVLNEINGMNSAGTQSEPVPAIFGMNFQSVSVGEKLVDPVQSCVRNPTPTCNPSYFPGGYLPGTLTFTPQMTEALTYVDGAIGSMVSQLRANNLIGSTEIIISAKHGQSPIDPSRLAKIGDAVSPLLTDANVTIGQNTEDDISLIWLRDQTQTSTAVTALTDDQTGANTARISTVLSGTPLINQFGNPQTNARTPDIIVEPIPGTIYTTSGKKVAEHGGFAPDDTHVAMLVYNGAAKSNGSKGHQVKTAVTTTQIAPTILQYLGLDPLALNSVVLEGTQPLPK
jgi:hypothetical protein